MDSLIIIGPASTEESEPSSSTSMSLDVEGRTCDGDSGGSEDVEDLFFDFLPNKEITYFRMFSAIFQWLTVSFGSFKRLKID